MNHFTIAIDGPSGAGKSSMAKRLAKEFDCIYLDTGAMYRSFALFTLKNGVVYSKTEIDTEKIEALLGKFNLDVVYEDGAQQMIVNGENVTGMIRTPDVSIAASKVAVIPKVRLALVEIQRRIASEKNCVMDGRDIGTYVLPDAEVKIFLTASAEKRAERRYKEDIEAGRTDVTYEQVLEDIKFRDKNDSSRAFAPLKKADDATLVDSSDIGIEETMEVLRNIVRSKTK
ncbi:MAG: (d)CMP kinase [Clostridia bacterium]|nr:(d)CMP kinase [Clostridia bacterium]